MTALIGNLSCTIQVEFHAVFLKGLWDGRLDQERYMEEEERKGTAAVGWGMGRHSIVSSNLDGTMRE